MVSECQTVPSKFKSSNGEHQFHVDSYMPSSALPVAGTVLFCHGMGEYGSRYEHVFKMLNNEGLAVIAPTYVGFGASEGPRRIIPSFSVIVDDVITVSVAVEAAFPGVHRFIMAHSMGGAIAAMVAARAPHAARDGVVMTAPLFGLYSVQSSLLSLAIRLGSRMAPGWVPSSIPEDALTHPSMKWGAEPLRNKGSPLMTLAEMVRMMPTLDPDTHTVPTLALLAEADVVVDNAATRRFMGLAGPHCTVKEVAGARHEVLRDIDWRRTAQTVVDWMARRSSKE